MTSPAALARQLGNWRTGDGSRPGTPGYVQLADALTALVRDGVLPVGSRLPAERTLAAALQVSRTTVTAAYGRLADAGVVRRRHGSGTTVQTLPGIPPAGAGNPLVPWGTAATVEWNGSHVPATHLLGECVERATPLLADVAPAAGFDPVGLPGLRAAIADRLSARGLPTTPEQVVVTNGAVHGLALLVDVVCRAGDRAVVEHPTYPTALDVLRRGHVRPVPTPVTVDGGWDGEALLAALRRPQTRLAYLMPDFQNPTGHVMSDPLRARLAEEAARAGTLLVVDDTIAELDLGPPHAGGATPTSSAATSGSSPASGSGLADRPSLAPFGAAQDHLVLLGSTSKTCWAGLRVGWVRAAPDLLERLVRRRMALDAGTPVLEQLVSMLLLQRLDEVLAERRATLRPARDALLAALQRHVPDWSVRSPGGGLVLWCELGRDVGLPVSSALVSVAAREGIRLVPGPVFGVGGAFDRFLRLPYTLPIPTLVAATAVLGQVWTQVRATLTDPVEHPGRAGVFS